MSELSGQGKASVQSFYTNGAFSMRQGLSYLVFPCIGLVRMTTCRIMSLDQRVSFCCTFQCDKTDIADGSLVAVDALQIRCEPCKAFCRHFVLLNLPKRLASHWFGNQWNDTLRCNHTLREGFLSLKASCHTGEIQLPFSIAGCLSTRGSWLVLLSGVDQMEIACRDLLYERIMEEMLVTAEGLKLLPLRKFQPTSISIDLVTLARDWVSQHGGHVPSYAVPIFSTWDFFQGYRSTMRSIDYSSFGYKGKAGCKARCRKHCAPPAVTGIELSMLRHWPAHSLLLRW
jgi:hypothetical protein